MSTAALAHHPMPGRKIAGAIIAVVTILILIALAFHPTEAGASPDDIFAAILRDQLADRLVHGLMIALVIGLGFGFSEFASKLGLDRPLVRLGLIAYGLGCVTIILAALTDGFLTPMIAERFQAATPEQFKLGYNLLVYANLSIQALTKLGLVVWSFGILFWSAELLHRAGSERITGLVGLVASLPALAFILAGIGFIGPHLLILIMLAQAAWNFAVARLLIVGSA